MLLKLHADTADLVHPMQVDPIVRIRPVSHIRKPAILPIIDLFEGVLISCGGAAPLVTEFRYRL